MTHDGITGNAVGIGQGHHEIHEGNTYVASYKSAEGADVADDGTVVFAFTTRSTYCHLVARAACGGDMEGEMYEGSTLAAGTSVNIFNKNRGRVARQQASVERDGAVVDAGTLLENELIPGGSGPMAVGSSASHSSEWVLAPDTTYMFRMTNRSGGAQPMSLALEWYEMAVNR